MAEFLTEIGAFFTQSLTWVTEVLNVITDSPALLILCIAMPIVGFGVGLLSRMFRVN